MPRIKMRGAEGISIRRYTMGSDREFTSSAVADATGLPQRDVCMFLRRLEEKGDIYVVGYIKTSKVWKRARYFEESDEERSRDVSAGDAGLRA